MTLSELIASLNAMLAENGDIQVFVADYHGHQPITHIHTEYHPEPWDHEIVVAIDTRDDPDDE